MRRGRLPTVAALVAAMLAGAAAAQDAASPFGVAVDRDLPVTLVADEVIYDERAGTVTARGAVEVFYGERTLTASAIVYDSRAGRISAEGPITLRAEQGVTVFADAADLDAELRDGIVSGARAIIDGGAAQIASVEGRRVEGRYTAFSKVVYSACAVCPEAPTPLWAIRARRAVHDDVERVVHYEDAVFEVFGAPVAWLPFFTFPDPTVRRRSGFLPPTFQNSTNYGFAAKIPYFVAIDDSRDATITAFPTTRDGPILEGEYRQRLDIGGFDFRGSGGALDSGDGEGLRFRGHLFGEGDFDADGLGLPIGDGARAGFDLAMTTDDGYLRRYDFTSRDRLENEAYLERYGARDFFDLSALYFLSLREDEPDGGIPVALPRFEMREAFDAPLAGGELGVGASGTYLTRTEGRDVGRLSLAVDWSRREVLDGGLLLRGFAQARADVYGIADDPDFGDENPTRLAPFAGVEARFPLVSADGAGTHLFEPVAQIVVAPEDVGDDDIPNEDSTIVEFDETNLFDPDRFPGYDRFETGARANLGFRYAWESDSPFRADVSAGRVFRLTESGAFSDGSGLGATRSDHVAAWGVAWGSSAELRNRVRIADDGDLERNEVAGRLDLGRVRLDGAYVFLEKDATAGALATRAEGALGAEVDLTRNWTVGGFARRDFEEDRYVDIAATVAYQTECAALEFFAGRDFTDSEDDPAATTVGLRVRLFGTADGRERRSAVCGLRPSP